MSSDIIVALVSFAGSSLGVLAGVIGANKLTEFRQDREQGRRARQKDRQLYRFKYKIGDPGDKARRG